MVWLLIGYMFLFIDRPFEVWPILGDMYLERVYMLFTMAMWCIAPGKRLLPNVQHLGVIAFAGAVLITWGMSPWMEAGQVGVENWFKVLVFYVLLVTSINTEKDLRRILGGFLVVMAIYLLHSLKEFLGGRHVYRMSIARMVGVDTSMGDPNSFGSTIIYSLPIVTVFWSVTTSKLLRLGLLGYVGLCMLCILLTGSRGSLLGLIMIGGILMLRSRRIVLYGILAVLFSPVIFMALPESLQNRFHTIIDPSVGPANAIESGQGRIDGFFTGMELLAESPLVGIGPGAWRPRTRSIIESHNLYGQVAGEMGMLGIVSFFGMVLLVYHNIRTMNKLRKRYPPQSPDEEFLYRTARAVGLMFFMMLSLGMFGHNLFRYNWLWFGGILIIAHHCVLVRLKQRSMNAAPMRLPRVMPVGFPRPIGPGSGPMRAG
ncbi:O-antigen ligase family protein [Tuwongella immobilis]|uniref:O-antigen ligase-related domain-containing protein n=1 Tax=Tuwongella immobilis TaxID=692036 RepID=A0A6C2YSL2_9BACT|nr:O-antigen ligase family protein [Tuwongella immobilis]VIP04133.1 Uncharacterized protein OS=Desulfovibrio sp. X2 GN=dsx2_1171 PE=4 SV=1: O-antigen_lig [Tuwongella immobilis]VTS05631.1 Uncharacterized protein OS=Desulfovibrio sp. X2 GN=dsx2_1171 PE=4 SV=1: O-antigen_lig [Tuwongella immobilis]